MQKAVCDLLTVYERMGKLAFFAVPNGGKRSKVEASIMKACGMRSGVPDLVVLIPGAARTLFWELKAGKNTLDEPQKGWRDWIMAAGYEWREIRSVDDAENALHAYVGKVAA